MHQADCPSVEPLRYGTSKAVFLSHLDHLCSGHRKFLFPTPGPCTFLVKTVSTYCICLASRSST
eukprot:9486776-Pyramimonas_sp.AAC.1